MIAPQTYSNYPPFGSSATKCQPVQVKYDTGYIPGDVLPAEHLNWFLAGATCNITLASAGIVNLQQEMQTILCCAGQAPSSCLTCVDQVYNAMMYQINASAAQRAPTAHASSATTYGVGTADSYGHLKISDTYTEVLSACSGVAASQKALACVYAAAGAKAGVGNTAGCPLGTASAGVATTAARSDHVHPVTGLATTCVDSTNWPGIGAAGNYTTFIRATESGFIPYCEDATNGSGSIGVYGWPFAAVYAKNFYGTLHGNADTSTYANQVTGASPINAGTQITPGLSFVRNVVSNVAIDNFGYLTRMAIGLYMDGQVTACGFSSGLISIGKDDNGTQWDNFYFRQGEGGVVITSATIGAQSVARATSAGSADSFVIDGLTSNPTWHWSGQSGQPSWLWGSNDGVNMYVWNPANFNVNYAISAGSAGCATEANCACYARCLHFEQLTNNTACPVYYYFANGKTYLCATGTAMVWITNPYGVPSSSPSIYKAGVSEIRSSEGDPGLSYIKF